MNYFLTFCSYTIWLLYDGFFVGYTFTYFFGNLVIFFVCLVFKFCIMKNFILGVILTSLLSFEMHLYFQNQSLISQVNTLKSNIISNNENLQKVKESYYIEQQNRDTTLILFTVTALFGLFSFFTFTSVKRMFEVNISEINNKYDEQVAENQKVIIHIKNLEGDLSFETAKNISSSFDLFKQEYTNDEYFDLKYIVVELVYQAFCRQAGYIYATHSEIPKLIPSVFNLYEVFKSTYTKNHF